MQNSVIIYQILFIFPYQYLFQIIDFENMNENSNEQKNDISYDNLTKQNLIIVITEKIKEIKTLSSKNSKLETKYINTYKQNKAYKKDYEHFIKIFKIIFEGFEEKPIGTYEFTEFQLSWKKIKNQFEEKIKNLQQEAIREKTNIENKYKNQFEIKIQQLSQKNKNEFSNFNKEIQSLEQLNEKYVSEISVLSNKINQKDEEINKISNQKIKIQHQLNDIRVNSVKSQLEKNVNDLNFEPKLRQQRQSYLIIQQELESVIQKNQQLKQTILSLQNKLRTKNKEIELLKNHHENQATSPQLPKVQKMMKQTSEIKQKSEENGNHNKKQNHLKNTKYIQKEEKSEYIQKQYLKHVFLRYMKSLSENNHVQAQILENVLTTILEFAPKEKQITAIRRRQWWNIFK